MFSFARKVPFIPVIVFSIAVLASCSSPKGPQGIESGSCTPTSASAGSEVACQTKALEEDCTLFFGKQPIDFERDASDNSVNFTVPTVPAGEVSITARCGEDAPVIIQDGFVVLALPSNPENTTPEAIEEFADGDQVIAPSAPSAAAAPAPAPSDIPTPSPPSPVEQPSGGGETSASLTIEKVTDATAHFSTYRIDWNVANAKAVYLAGNVFTRFWMDKGLPSECGKTADGRFLVTNPDGTNLNPGSSNFQPYREGAVCNEDNCASEILTEDVSLTPFCRIDLTPGADHVFVRNMAAQGRVCLAVQGFDDAWETVCKTIEAPKPKLIVADNSIAISEEKPVITLHFEYENAAGRPKAAGCTDLSDVQATGMTGKGIYQAECPLEKIKTTIAVTVQGIGAGDVDSRSFDVVLWKPVGVSLKLYGAGPGPNQEGIFQLQYGVSRFYSVLDLKTNTFLGGFFSTCPWVKAVRFKGFAGEYDFHAVTKASDVSGTKFTTVADGTWKTDDTTKWTFATEDFDDTYESAHYQVDHPANTNGFTMQIAPDSGGTDYVGPSCDEGLVFLRQGFTWKGKNVQSLTIAGAPGQVVYAKADQSQFPDTDPATEDEGSLLIIRELGTMNSAWDATMNFTITVVYHDGETEDVTKNVTGYGCH